MHRSCRHQIEFSLTIKQGTIPSTERFHARLQERSEVVVGHDQAVWSELSVGYMVGTFGDGDGDGALILKRA